MPPIFVEKDKKGIFVGKFRVQGLEGQGHCVDSVYKNLTLAILCCVSPTKSRYEVRLASSCPRSGDRKGAERGHIKNRQKFRVACLQNETAPEKNLNQYEKGFEKRAKRSEKRSETCLKKF